MFRSAEASGRLQPPIPAVLHIGTEKTGTTTIQAFLSDNRRQLRSRQNIFVPRSCGSGNCRDLATYAIRDDYYNEDRLIELGIRDRPAKERYKRDVEARFFTEMEDMRPFSGRVVLSSEHLQSRLKSVEEVVTLRDLLERSGLRVATVLVYLREQAATYASLYSTALRAGSTLPPPSEPNMPHWNHICDHRATIERWTAAFPKAEITPRLFEPTFLVGGDLLTDFCTVVVVDPKGLRRPDSRNIGLTEAGQMLLREVNIEAPWLLEGRNARLRSEIVATIDRQFAGRGTRPSPALLERFSAHFAESNEWVRGRFFPERPLLFADESPLTQTTDGRPAPNDDAIRRWIDQKLKSRPG